MAKSRRAADAFEAITGPAPSPPDKAVEPAPEAAPKGPARGSTAPEAASGAQKRKQPAGDWPRPRPGRHP